MGLAGSGNNPNSLNLLPKAHDSFIVKIQIEFADERLDTLIMEDDLGNKTWFKFIRTERNPLLKDDLFRVEPPVDRDDDLGGFITH